MNSKNPNRPASESSGRNCSAIRRVLIVEDEALIGWALAQALTRAGFEVVLAESGERAIEFVRSSSFDIVITDVKLPHSTGIDVAATLRLVAPSTPIVLLSAESDEFLRQQFERYSIANIVEKPFDLAKIVSLVGALCKHDDAHVHEDE